MNFLPKEIEDIINDYKTSAENYIIAVDYIVNISNNINEDIFTNHINVNTGFNDELNNTINNMNEHFLNNFNFTLNIMEIYKIIIKNINNNIFEWIWIGSGNNSEFSHDNYAKIENLPIEFVREFKDKITWTFVGSGNTHNDVDHTKMENLPIEFVREFKDKIKWTSVGSGSTYRGAHYAKIENLPRDFIREFKDKICWTWVGRGNAHIDEDHTKLENLPRDFVREFKKYITDDSDDDITDDDSIDDSIVTTFTIYENTDVFRNSNAAAFLYGANMSNFTSNALKQGQMNNTQHLALAKSIAIHNNYFGFIKNGPRGAIYFREQNREILIQKIAICVNANHQGSTFYLRN